MTPGGETPRGNPSSLYALLSCRDCKHPLAPLSAWPSKCPHCGAPKERLAKRVPTPDEVAAGIGQR